MDRNSFYLQLGQAIRARRERLGLTQTELAERVGLSRTSVTNVERGRQQVLLHQVVDFAKALRTDVAALTPTDSVDRVLHQPKERVPTEIRRLLNKVRSARSDRGPAT
jgi:transcriptional regulator with XRE-family HTH domain